MYKYGVTREQAEALSAIVECQICGAGDTVLQVDHDHACCPGKYACGNCVRGMVCAGCNAFLGKVGDDVDRLAERMRDDDTRVAYLRQWLAKAEREQARTVSALKYLA